MTPWSLTQCGSYWERDSGVEGPGQSVAVGRAGVLGCAALKIILDLSLTLKCLCVPLLSL